MPARKNSTSLRRMSRQMGVEADKLDIYLQYLNNEVLWEPDPDVPRKPALTDTQREMFLKYSVAWGMASTGRTDEMIRSALEKQFGIKEGQARYIIEESYHIYGSATEVNRRGKTRAAILYLEMLSNLARSEKDYKTAESCWVKAKELEGLYEKEKEGFDPAEFAQKPTVIFANNINILKQQQRADDE